MAALPDEHRRRAVDDAAGVAGVWMWSDVLDVG
jgi:hypothetical protein